ncbi:MAG: tyrosine-type recombinase/integrase [Actinomycetota bacterium]
MASPAVPALVAAAEMAAIELFASVRAWRDFLEVNRYSPDTIQNYYRYVRAILFDIGVDRGLDPTEITEEVFTRYLLELNPHAPTRETIIAAAKSYWKYATRRGIYPENPAGEIRNRTTPAKPANPLTEEELVRVLVATSWADLSGRRAWTLLLQLETGARVSSLAAILEEDVPRDPQPGRYVHFRFAKNNRPYSLPLTPLAVIAVRELQAWDGFRHRPTLIGVNKKAIADWYKRAAVAAGVPRAKQGTHCLRDTFATNLAERNDVPIQVILKALNHADYRSLHRYLLARDPLLEAAFEQPSFGEHTTRAESA